MMHEKLEAKLDGVYLRKGQYVNINGKYCTLEHWSFSIKGEDAGHSLTFKYNKPYVKDEEFPVIETIEVFDRDLAKALGVDILGYVE